MKVLVISLLRLGDFIQTVPVINGLAARSGHRVDVLVHKSVAQLSKNLASVGQWWTLDRDEIQAGLGQAEIPMLTSFHVLKEQLKFIEKQDYDLIINLSHTRFSGFLTGFLQAKNKIGLNIETSGRATFNSPWFRYLDLHAQNPVEDVLNYSDIFMQACDLPDADWSMRSTADGEKEVNSLGLNSGPITTVQVLTSDSKKNWSRNSWISFLDSYHKYQPNQQIVLLGAPNEKATLDGYISDLANRGISAHLGILSLDGALALLNRSQLLITGDTSIKHLANASTAKIMELSLGSSDLRRTGVYKSGSLIIASRVACAPCAHSSACPLSQHLCGQSFDPIKLAEIASQFQNDRWTDITTASNHQSGLRILQTRRLHSGLWLAVDLSDELATIRGMLHRSSWKFICNQEHRRPISTIGSESVGLKEDFAQIFSIKPSCLAHLDFIENEITSESEGLSGRLGEIPKMAKTAAIEFGKLRQKQIELDEANKKTEIQRKLIRSLKSQITETI